MINFIGGKGLFNPIGVTLCYTEDNPFALVGINKTLFTSISRMVLTKELRISCK